MHPVGCEKLTLGTSTEIDPYDFTELGEDASWLMYKIHWTMKQELMNRNIFNLYAWSTRTMSILISNQLMTIGDVCNISLESVNRLTGCGFKTRREVYLTFKNVCNIKLKQWNPDEYIERYRMGG